MKLKMILEFHLISREQKYRIEIYWYCVAFYYWKSSCSKTKLRIKYCELSELFLSRVDIVDHHDLIYQLGLRGIGDAFKQKKLTRRV